MILGGWLGAVIAWSLCHSKEQTPDGEFPTYNARSRAAGKIMFPIACITGAFSILAWLYQHFR